MGKYIYTCIISLFVLISITFLTVTGYLYSISVNLPKIKNVIVNNNQSATVFDYSTNSSPLSIKQVPISLIQSTLIIEDPHFYKRQPATFGQILRAFVFILAKGQTLSDGSTITINLAKHAVNTKSTMSSNLNYQIKVLLMAMKIDQLKKDEILDLYFNESFYGEGIVGVEKASKTYFNKSAGELTAEESAILAGIPQSPAIYSPFSKEVDENGQFLWRRRADYIIKLLQKNQMVVTPTRKKMRLK